MSDRLGRYLENKLVGQLKVVSYSLSFEKRTSVFNHGLVTFDHVISTTEKLAVMDELSSLSGCEIDGQRKQNSVAFWNPAVYESIEWKYNLDGSVKLVSFNPRRS